MADKPARHKRLYKDSPRLERGDDGKMAAKKPSEGKKPETDGEPDMEPHKEARVQEVKDMHKRHQTEMAAVYDRHAKEDAKKYAETQHATDSNESAGAGAKEVAEIDASKENTE